MKPTSTKRAAAMWSLRTQAAARKYQAGIEAPRRGAPNPMPGAAEAYAAAVEPSKSKYAQGWAPYREALLKLRLPPRGPVGSEQNIRRTQLVCLCMMRVKARLARQQKRGRK